MSATATVLRAGILTLAGAVGAGLVAVGVAANAADSSDDLAAKRDEQVSEWAVDADDDDDDDRDGQTNTRTGQTNTRSDVSGPETRTGQTGTNTNDKTGSRVSAVSRDRDLSRGDQTRDWTRDGGDRTRDFSRNLTNDNSRNDTR